MHLVEVEELVVVKPFRTGEIRQLDIEDVVEISADTAIAVFLAEFVSLAQILVIVGHTGTPEA